MAAYIVGSGEEHAFYVRLAVNIARDFGNAGEITDRIRTIRGHSRLWNGRTRRSRSGSGLRLRGSALVLRRYPRAYIQLTQFVVLLFFTRKQLLDALQTLHSLRAHRVLEEYLSL